MTKPIVTRFTFLFGAAAFVLTCLAGPQQPQPPGPNDFSHVVQLNKTWSQGEDRITIREVRGPYNTRNVGSTYEVRGVYKLTSRDAAIIAANVTARPEQSESGHGSIPGQTAVVHKGEGEFTLRFHMWHEGKPHVSFYPAPPGGASFGGAYF
jgi:hypothetical protein